MYDNFLKLLRVNCDKNGQNYRHFRKIASDIIKSTFQRYSYEATNWYIEDTFLEAETNTKVSETKILIEAMLHVDFCVKIEFLWMK